MERLTERLEGGIRIKGCTTLYASTQRKGARVQNAIIKLCAYEDTNLEPEEIMELITPKVPQEEKGLYEKYTVIKTETGEAVKDCFILRPGKDPAAATAIRAYANATTNKVLSDDLRRWVGEDSNPPLTLEELREMDGEPVWLEVVGGCGHYVMFFGVDIRGEAGFYNEISRKITDYGKTWLSYRRKPEEAGK